MRFRFPMTKVKGTDASKRTKEGYKARTSCQPLCRTDFARAVMDRDETVVATPPGVKLHVMMMVWSANHVLLSANIRAWKVTSSRDLELSV